MKIFDLDKNEIPKDKYYIGLGDFDGVHIAHKKIIKNLMKTANSSNCQSAILLFKSPTSKTFGLSGNILTSLDQKLEILQSIGLENVFLISFDNIKNLDNVDFLKKLLDIGVKGIFVGFDYKYGKNALGNVDSLQEFASIHDVFVNIMRPLKYDEIVISSTEIRKYIENCDFKMAEKLLGRPYSLRGYVVTGKKIGSKLGFPTANINLIEDYKLPKEGVYFCKLKYNNKIYDAATSLGRNVSFNEDKVKIESHIINFDQDIYDKNVEIRFIKYLRPMFKYNDIKDLVNQVQRDIDQVKDLSR